MSGTGHHRRLEVLDEEEGRRRLAGAVIGRLAFTEGALPAIQPLRFARHAVQILIRWWAARSLPPRAVLQKGHEVTRKREHRGVRRDTRGKRRSVGAVKTGTHSRQRGR